jgi:DNA-binding XRE family transcriptional regulator
MSRRSATITQADIARAIRAAKQTGATEVEVRIADQFSIVIRLSTGDEKRLEPAEEIVL